MQMVPNRAKRLIYYMKNSFSKLTTPYPVLYVLVFLPSFIKITLWQISNKRLASSIAFKTAFVNVHLKVKEKHLIYSLLLDSRIMKLRDFVKNLDPNKAHGPDKVSICMLKHVVVLFPNLFNSCLDLVLRTVCSAL